MDKWISVKDDLPKSNQVFITWNIGYDYGDSAVLFNRPDGSGYVIFNCHVSDIYLKAGEHFTHWQPLPSPPKQ